MISRIHPSFGRSLVKNFSSCNKSLVNLPEANKALINTGFTKKDAMNSWGILTSIDARNCDWGKIRDAKYIEKYVVELCKFIDMKRFGPCQVVFFGEDDKVAGYSMVQLIQTSCISGHFANATNASYIDIFSCKYYDPDKAAKFTADFFGSKDFTYNTLLRK